MKLALQYHTQNEILIIGLLGSSVKTGGSNSRGMAWASQMILSSQRPYTSSSLSMGKMEYQGLSSSRVAVKPSQNRKKNSAIDKTLMPLSIMILAEEKRTNVRRITDVATEKKPTGHSVFLTLKNVAEKNTPCNNFNKSKFK